MGKHTHIPMRMCLVCRNRFSKAELTRFTRQGQDELMLDEAKTAPGRGCYLCQETACKERFAKLGVKRKVKGRKA